MTLNRNGFQTFVNTYMPPAVVGDFASMNPRAVALAGPGAFRADEAAPIVVGFFGWGKQSDGIAYGSEQAGSVLGFVANELQTVITEFLGQSRLVVQAGFPVTLYTHGDFWAYVAGGPVAVGDAIFADAATGEPTIDDDSGANPDTGYVAMTPSEATGTSSAASIAAGTGVLTVGGSVAGTFEVGQNISGVGIPNNLFIKSQLTGAAGGAGTYQLNTIGAAVGPVAITATSGQLVKISRTF